MNYRSCNPSTPFKLLEFLCNLEELLEIDAENIEDSIRQLTMRINELLESEIKYKEQFK